MAMRRVELSEENPSNNGILFDYRLYPGQITSCEIYNHSHQAVSLKGFAHWVDLEYKNMRKSLKWQNKMHDNELDDLCDSLDSLS